MPLEAPFGQLGRELDAAAARQTAAAWGTTPAPAVAGPHRRDGGPGRRCRRGRSRLGCDLIVVVGLAVAVRAGHRAPAARRAPPIAGTVKLLSDHVADPDGGPPWGLRYWETDRKYACVQVGRVYAGKLGQISRGKVFHEMRLGVTEGRSAAASCKTGPVMASPRSTPARCTARSRSRVPPASGPAPSFVGHTAA